ncbi:MAG: site-specific integrase [Bacteroidales bacterium]|nr:site-specific integrase [Bacteroidales bacterium]
MKRTTYSVLFFVRRTRAVKNGELPIYARITVDGQRAEFATQLSIADEYWDNGKGCARGGNKKVKEVNNRLDFIRLKLQEHKIMIEEFNEVLTAYTLRDAYMGIDSNSQTLMEVFEAHNEKCRGLKGKDFAPATVTRYETCKRHLEEFIQAKYKRSDVKLKEVTPMFINDYEYFLKTKRGCAHNTATKYIKNFKKIIRIALANGWIKRDPFANIKFHLDEVEVAYLTEQELDTIMNKKFFNLRLQQVKDIYVFCCLTGLAYIDVEKLTKDKIVNIDGKYWIKTRRHKTNQMCSIPLLAPALEIINQYKTHPACVKENRVLPVLTNQKMNAYIKEIADICGIEKKLSTHTARHTFATTVTLTNGLSLESVSKMLGHSSINMTKRYARVVDDKLARDMAKLDFKYGATGS